MSTIPELIPLTRPLVGLDLETTGTNPLCDRVVSVGLVIFRPGQAPQKWKQLINPGVLIPPGATAKHHITDDMVRTAPRFAQFATRMAEGFTDVDFAGYNVRFDLQVLYEEFRRIQIKWDFEDAKILDSLRLWQVLEPRSLSNAVRYWLKEEPTDAHDALYDIEQSLRVMAAQLEARSEVVRTVDALHALGAVNAYDAIGKLRWRDGELVMAFGEHRDIPLRNVPSSYLYWILKKDFSDKVKDTCRNALKGIYPTPPAPTEDPDESTPV